MDVYFLMKRSIILNTLSDTARARLYIGKTDSLGSDYIEFNYNALWVPKLYYVQNDGFYVEDENGSFEMVIRQNEFNIHYVNIITKYPEDSIRSNPKLYIYGLDDLIKDQKSAYIEKPHYSISIGEGASSIAVFNPDKKLIYNSY